MFRVPRMTRRSATLAAGLAVAVLGLAGLPDAVQAQTPPGATSPAAPVAFLNVNVVPMDSARVLPGHTAVFEP